MIKIRLVGCGCDACITTETNIKSAVEQMGVQIDFSRICDHATQMTPILFINDKLISAGKTLSKEEFKEVLIHTRKKNDREE